MTDDILNPGIAGAVPRPGRLAPPDPGSAAGRQAGDIAARLACAVAAARPLLEAAFELCLSVRLEPEAGGGELSFRCSRDRVLCLAGGGDGPVLLAVPVLPARVLN